nr:ribonuclease H-like domain-containing protein [Tanacetum cinerariifolium]
YQAEEEPANFALMAISSSSSASDNEACLGLVTMILGIAALTVLAAVIDTGLDLVRNFMPPKPDLVFHTAPIAVETAHSAFTVHLSPAKPAQDISYVTRPMAPIIEDWVSDSEDESEPNDPQSASSFVQTSEHVKLSGHSAQPVEASILETTPNSTSSKTNGSRRKNRKTCFVCRGVDHLIKDCIFHAKPKTHMSYDKQYASSTKKYSQKHIIPVAVLTKSKPVSVTTAKTLLPGHAKVVSAAKGKKGKWNKGVIDSGCSRHMTWNMSYLSNFQELNGGYVAFGGNPKGGKISGKGKIKTGLLSKMALLRGRIGPLLRLPELCWVLVTKAKNKTPYELLHGRTPSIGFMRPFGCPVTILNTLDSLGFQEEFDAGKIGEKANQQYMLFPVWSTGSTNPQNKEGDATFDGKEHDAEKPESTINLSPSSSALSGEQDDMAKKKDKGKSPVDYFIGNRDFNKDFEDYFEDSSNDVSAAGPIVPTAGQNYSNNINPISVADPSNTNTSPIHGKYLLQDAS